MMKFVLLFMLLSVLPSPYHAWQGIRHQRVTNPPFQKGPSFRLQIAPANSSFRSSSFPVKSLEPPTERRKKSQNSRAIVGHVLGAALFVSLVGSNPLPSMAVNDDIDVAVLNHEYSDPLHPLCRRTIRVDDDGKTFHYSGTAVGRKDDSVALRGCSSKEIKQYGLRTATFDGQILQPGLRLSVGDGIHEGQWEPANSILAGPSSNDLQYKAVDGIRWNDGNKWIVKEEVPKTLATAIGEWIFLAYIGFSTLAGVKGVYDKIQEKRSRTAN